MSAGGVIRSASGVVRTKIYGGGPYSTSFDSSVRVNGSGQCHVRSERAPRSHAPRASCAGCSSACPSSRRRWLSGGSSWARQAGSWTCRVTWRGSRSRSAHLHAVAIVHVAPLSTLRLEGNLERGGGRWLDPLAWVWTSQAELERKNESLRQRVLYAVEPRVIQTESGLCRVRRDEM